MLVLKAVEVENSENNFNCMYGWLGVRSTDSNIALKVSLFLND